LENIHRLRTEALVDLLSMQTDTYYQMQAMCATEEEFAKCKLLIRAIQKEIDLRKKRDTNLNPSNEEILAE